MKMFQKIQELIDDKDALVCVLIDEVSLAANIIVVLSGHCLSNFAIEARRSHFQEL